MKKTSVSKAKVKAKSTTKKQSSEDKSFDKAQDKLNKILDRIRPALVSHSGNLELVSYDRKNGIVEIVLQGACAHCPLADVTLKHLVEAEIRGAMPEVKEVRAV